MASPLSYLRKNQYLMLVGFGVLLMFAFVVAPPLQQYMDSSSRNAHDPVLVKWDHGRIRQSDLERMRYEHNVLHNFLDDVRRATEEKEGVPKAQPALYRARSEKELLDMLLLSKKAELQGMRISADALTNYLAQLSDSVLTQQEFRDLLDKNKQVPSTRIFNRLRLELLGQNMQNLYRTAAPVSTPADLWEAHARLARNVDLDLYPLEVADFIDKVKEDPPVSELKELFEEGKTRAPDPDAPDPGFAILPTAKFQYVKADFDAFLENAKQTVTEEEIKARYDSGIKLREFLKETPKAPKEEPVITPPPKLSVDEPEDAPKDKPEDAPKDKPEDAPKDKPEDAPKDKPEDAPKDKPEDAPKDKPEDAPEDGDLPPLEAPGAALPAESTQFVSAPVQDDSSEEKAETKAAPPKLAPADGGDSKAETEGDSKTEATPEAEGSKGDDSPFESEKDEFKPLEEVREQIVLELARGRAQEKLDEALEGAQRDVEAYYRKRIQWEAMQTQAKGNDPDGEEPVLNMEALAKKYGLTAGATEFVNAITVEETELGKCSREQSSIYGETTTIKFRDDAFRQGKLFDPARASQGETSYFVYWRSDEKDGKIPEYAEVEEQVKEAWIRNKARELATAEAEKLADQAGDKPLADVVSDTSKIKSTGKFAWLTVNTPGGMQFGAMPRMTELPAVEGADAAFMAKVFELEAGEAGVATNASKSIVYVVKMTEESATDELREDFIADYPAMEMQIASSANYQVIVSRMQELEKEMGVTYMLNE